MCHRREEYNVSSEGGIQRVIGGRNTTCHRREEYNVSSEGGIQRVIGGRNTTCHKGD